MTLRFISRASATDGGTKNILSISNIPTDLAITIDTVVDGKTTQQFEISHTAQTTPPYGPMLRQPRQYQ